MRRFNWTKIKDNTVNVVIALIILAGLGGYADGIYATNQTNTLANEIITLQNKAATASTNHHDETTAQNQTIIDSQNEIKYLLGVVVFLTGEIHSTQMDNASTLQVIKTVQAQVAELAPIINGIPPADATLGSLATQLIASFQALSGDVQAACTAAGISCTVPTLNAK